MTKKRIDNPKIFISYAWADEDYQNQVLGLATQLMGDGIDVVLDKWNLTEGNDTYAFMEKCATDPSITNVLMLLDPVYAKKADNHSGGVGVETQIISGEVYQKVDQDKFIPVVMKRDEDGGVCKPTYLKGRLHFDLSIPEKYDDEYCRLVKKLYGVEVYKKPEVGKRPEWVDNPSIVAPKTIITYGEIKRMQTPGAQSEMFWSYLGEIKDSFLTFASKYDSESIAPDKYIALYRETDAIKTSFLQLVRNSIFVKDSVNRIASFFEETANGLPQFGAGRGLCKIRIHELFIYTVAYFLKAKDYSDAGNLLGKTYFNNRRNRDCYGADNYHMFYSGSEHQRFDYAMSQRDEKRYYTGVGQYWIETMASDFCSKEQFVLADLICYNYSVYGENYFNERQWFPITYIYDDKDNGALQKIGKKLSSREFAQELVPLFGFNDIDELISRMNLVEEKQSTGEYRRIGYSSAFENARLLGDYIKPKDVGYYR